MNICLKLIINKFPRAVKIIFSVSENRSQSVFRAVAKYLIVSLGLINNALQINTEMTWWEGVSSSVEIMKPSEQLKLGVIGKLDFLSDDLNLAQLWSNVWIICIPEGSNDPR